MECRVWSAKCGSRVWSVKCGEESRECGVCSVECEV